MQDGKVALLSGKTGKVAWIESSHATNLKAGDAAITYDDLGVYVFTKTGVSAFAENGRRRWTFTFPEASTLPSLSDEGYLYSCDKSGRLCMFQADNYPRDVPHSKYYGPDPEGDYGLGDPPLPAWVRSGGDEYSVDMQEDMLRRITDAVKNGNIGQSEPEYVAYMMAMIGYFRGHPNLSLVRAPVKVPMRVQFLHLLGYMGSRETIPFLADIYNKDPEPAIKAACCEAIGRIGVDPKGDAVQAYTFLLSRDNANRDSQTLLSATDSITALCRFSGPPLASDGVALLTAIATYPDFRPDVRKHAQEQLNGLRKEGLDKKLK
jgi:outer membrane protein assembly factor BamB